MRAWKENGQRSCVTSMEDGDFFGAEQSHIMAKAGNVKITLHQADGNTKVCVIPRVKSWFRFMLLRHSLCTVKRIEQK